MVRVHIFVNLQVLERYVPPDVPLRYPGNVLNRDSTSIGEATTPSFDDKSVDQGDAVAIQVVEMRATGTNEITPSGVASMAQSATNVNPRIMRDKNKTTLYDVLAVINFCALLIFSHDDQVTWVTIFFFLRVCMFE